RKRCARKKFIYLLSTGRSSNARARLLSSAIRMSPSGRWMRFMSRPLNYTEASRCAAATHACVKRPISSVCHSRNFSAIARSNTLTKEPRCKIRQVVAPVPPHVRSLGFDELVRDLAFVEQLVECGDGGEERVFFAAINIDDF